MTDEEAKKVLKIAEGADGGCSYCVQSLVDDLKVSFPEHDWDALRKANDPYWA